MTFTVQIVIPANFGMVKHLARMSFDPEDNGLSFKVKLVPCEDKNNNIMIFMTFTHTKLEDIQEVCKSTLVVTQ